MIKMSKMININDLHREQNKKEEKRQEIYDSILDKVHQKIKLTSKTSADKFCFYSVPIYVYGLPLFDVNNCIIYLTKKLSDNGFDIRYTHPNLLLISWYEKQKKAPTPSMLPSSAVVPTVSASQRIEELRKKALDYRPTTDYQPNNNFIYDSNSLNALEEKANKLLYDSRF
jgi:hypothetical protein